MGFVSYVHNSEGACIRQEWCLDTDGLFLLSKTDEHTGTCLIYSLSNRNKYRIGKNKVDERLKFL